MIGRTVAVIGAGITGLTAALELADAGASRVVVLEASSRCGGNIRTRNVHGIPVDMGPDAFLAREPWGRDLCKRVGLADELTEPAVFGACLWSRGSLRPLPAGFDYGMPASVLDALRHGLLSPLGALRAALDLALPGPLRGPDVSIGTFVRRRFGQEVLERLVDPLLAGTRAGEPDRMSLAVAAPQIDALARRHRSTLVGLRRAREKGTLEAGAPPFLTVKGGLQRLVDAVLAHIRDRVQLRLRTPALRLTRTDRGYSLVAGDHSLEADAVIVAVPPYATAELIQPLSAEAATELDAIPYASAATVALVYPRDSFAAPQGASGLLMPSAGGTALAAATWYTDKWGYLDPPGGRQVVKCFAGRRAGDPSMELDDESLARTLAAEHAETLGITTRPESYLVERFPRSLPQYEVGHADRLERIERALAQHPGVILAGSGQGGSGIPDCIARAKQAAKRLSQAGALGGE